MLKVELFKIGISLSCRSLSQSDCTIVNPSRTPHLPTCVRLNPSQHLQVRRKPKIFNLQAIALLRTPLSGICKQRSLPYFLTLHEGRIKLARVPPTCRCSTTQRRRKD